MSVHSSPSLSSLRPFRHAVVKMHSNSTLQFAPDDSGNTYVGYAVTESWFIFDQTCLAFDGLILVFMSSVSSEPSLFSSLLYWVSNARIWIVLKLSVWIPPPPVLTLIFLIWTLPRCTSELCRLHTAVSLITGEPLFFLAHKRGTRQKQREREHTGSTHAQQLTRLITHANCIQHSHLKLMPWHQRK